MGGSSAQVQPKQIVPVNENGEAPAGSVAPAGKPKDGWFIDPQSAQQKKWDLFIILLLFFTALVTPAEVAFLEPKFNALFVINRLVDLGFIIDMVFQFALGIVDPDTFEMVYDRSRITRNYLTGWFVIDLVSIIPFDLLGLTMDSDNLSQLKVLRTVRLLRLIKLLRVLRSARIFARIEHSIGLSHASITLTKYILIIIITIHWSACYFAIVPAMAGQYPTWIEEGGLTDEGPAAMYLNSFEVGLMAFICGYGAYEPANSTERTWAIALMMCTLFIYAYFLGSICDVVANMDPATTEEHERMDTLNMYLDEINMEKSKCTKMREFVSMCTEMHRQRFYQEVLETLSPKLRGEFCEHTAGEWIRKVPFFVCADEEENRRFVIAIAQTLGREGYPRGEVIFKHNEVANKLYIVQSGIIGCRGRVLRKGSFIGEDMIMQSGRRLNMATALTFADMQVLGKDELEEVIDNGDFPQTEKLILIAAFRMSLRAYFRNICNFVKAQNTIANKEPMTEEEIEQWKLDNNRNLAAAKTSPHQPLVRKASYARPGTMESKAKQESEIEDLLRPPARKKVYSEASLDSHMKTLSQTLKELKTIVINSAVPTPKAKSTLGDLTGNLGKALGGHDERLAMLESSAREHTKFLQQALAKLDPTSSRMAL